MRIPCALPIFLGLAALASQFCLLAEAQGALLLQDADGISEVFSPMGHEAIYLARVCAAGPAKLRRCSLGESGAVIGRDSAIGGYDWLAMPLIPYLYSVEDASQVPTHVNRQIVENLRLQYHDVHLTILGNVREGGDFRRGWNQLVGAAYERRIWAFRFETTEAQDNALIAKMNADPNRSRFSVVFRNCADFSGALLNFYFPHAFGRRLLPDGGIVTPRQIAHELAKYGRKHPKIHLSIVEIPLVPGYHNSSRVGKSASESFVVTGYVIPIAILSPYAAGAIVVDTLIWGRYPLQLKRSLVASPQTVVSLLCSTTETTRRNWSP